MRLANGGEVEAKGVFTDEEWEFLQRFARFADELRMTNMARGARTAIQFKYNKDEGATWETTLPPADDVLAYIHRLRPFVLQGKDETPFPRAWNIFAKNVSEPRIRGALEHWRMVFFNTMPAEPRWSSGEVQVNAEPILTKWLNAFEYHRDRDKERDLTQLLEGFPPDVSRAIFVQMLMSKGQACLHLLQAIRAIEMRAAREGG